MSDTSGAVPNRGPAVFAVTTATLVLATVFVAARLFCRRFIVRNLSWDDRVMMLAWLLAFFLSFTINFGAANGLGKHDADITDHERPILRRCEYVFSILYNPALMATKTSILIFYLRLAKNTQVVLRYASWATLVVVNVAGIVLTFMNIFQCHPVDAGWRYNPNDDARCIPLLTEFICSSPVNIVTDLAILALPIPVLTGMRLPSRQKTILVVTFALGIFVTIVDVVRIYYLQRAISAVPTGASTDPSSHFGGQTDFAWNASLSLMWSAVEVNVGMTCACVPTLKPLILKLMPSMLRGAGNSSDDTFTKTPETSDVPSTRNAGVVSQAPPAALPSTPPPAHAGRSSGEGEDDGPMSAMEFLTMPDMVLQDGTGKETGLDGNGSGPGPGLGGGRPSRARTDATAMTGSSAPDNAVYFGFVNMARPKSMLHTSAVESWKYCTIVSVLFLLWGLSYGLLNTLNEVVASVNNMSTAQTLGLTSAYFGGGYFFGPLLVGEWILRRDEHNRTRRHGRDGAESVGGFKVTFIVGLCIYGIGTVIFWPSAVTASFGGFMLSNFVVGFGLSVLEVGANAFMVLCGPPAYGETRLMLAQGIQGIGSVVSGVLAQKVFFTDVGSGGGTNSTTLINVQWTYLGITLLSVILALFFFYMPLPEVNDSELDDAARHLPVDPQRRYIGKLQLRTVILVLAVLAQYTYVAGQECHSIFFANLLTSVSPGQDPGGQPAADNSNPDKPPGITLSITDYLLIGHSAFAVSRFMVAYLMYKAVSHSHLPRPRTILTVSVALCFLFALLTVVLRPSNPDMLVIPVTLFFFAEGPIWPLVFAIALRGQGRRTKRAAAFLTMGASGPAFFPFVMYGIIATGGTVQIAYIVIVALQAATMMFPLFVECVRDARMLLDPVPGLQQLLRDEERPVDELVAARRREHVGPNEKPSGILGRVSNSLGKRKASSSVPEAQHNEDAPEK